MLATIPSCEMSFLVFGFFFSFSVGLWLTQLQGALWIWICCRYCYCLLLLLFAGSLDLDPGLGWSLVGFVVQGLGFVYVCIYVPFLAC